MNAQACKGGFEAHGAHMAANGECPWCGALAEQEALVRLYGKAQAAKIRANYERPKFIGRPRRIEEGGALYEWHIHEADRTYWAEEGSMAYERAEAAETKAERARRLKRAPEEGQGRIGALILCAALLIGGLALRHARADKAEAPQGLEAIPVCAEEDAAYCFWPAQAKGNAEGRSFLAFDADSPVLLMPSAAWAKADKAEALCVKVYGPQAKAEPIGADGAVYCVRRSAP